MKKMIEYQANLKDFSKYLKQQQKSIIVVSQHLYEIYKDIFLKQQLPLILIEDNELNKNFSTVEYIISKLVEYKATRDFKLIAVGGGMITDLVAFVSTIYMRGVKLALVPTSLLAMVDAAIGGKNAVNFKTIKNLVGNFATPEEIIVNLEWLQSLPKEEIACGFAEIIKIALIANKNLLEELYNFEGINYRVPLKIIKSAINTKLAIVNQDYQDKGLRQKLNFGHTIAHALEHVSNNKLKHGFAVAVGMMVESSFVTKFCNSYSLESTLKELLCKYELPLTSDYLKNITLEILECDKKRENNMVNLVFFDKISSSKLCSISLKKLSNYII
jgi:3-dehydroquinate synthase